MPLGPTDPLQFKQLPFFPLSSGDQLLSIMFSAPSGFANTSGILPSGEANFLDFSQYEQFIYKPDFTPKTFTGIDHYSQSIVAPTGLDYYQSKQLIREPQDFINVKVNSDQTLNGNFIQALSNGTFSTYFSINDFSIFNPYVHHEASGLVPAVSAPYNAIDNYENTATDAHYYSWSFDPSSFISEAVTRFNIYSKQYRT